MNDLSGVRVIWEGAQFAPTSLALVNREICRRLVESGLELSCRVPDAAAEMGPPTSDFAALASCVGRPLSGPAQVEVRHQWPPRFGPSEAEALVLIQPWEFGSIPRDWPEAIAQDVDELWVPTNYVAGCFRDDGVDPRRLRVIPNGVDVASFHPRVTPRELSTRASRRLLFVGGTIGRKGIRALLEGYRRAFGPQDDVCLVIKDLGRGSIYEGNTEREQILRAVDDPDWPEILYLEETLPPPELPALFAACDILVHPYLGEGFGLPIAEAMAMEMPVVVTGRGASEDFVDDVVGWPVASEVRHLPEARVGTTPTCQRPWVAAPEIEDLARCLREALDDTQEAQRRGRAGRRRILERFTWDGVAEKVGDRLRDLLRRPSSEVVPIPKRTQPLSLR